MMYQLSSLAIAASLFVSMLLAIELGYRLGRRKSWPDAAIAQVSAVQAALLGLLALLLGFTFSLSLQRFDQRSAAVVAEANTIGTALLRTDLLPGDHGPRSRQVLADYIEQRIAAGRIELTRSDAREASTRHSAKLQQRLWAQAVLAAAEDPSPLRSGLYAQALNEMFDAQTSRHATLNRHVPELVLYLLYASFLLTGAILGLASGASRSRAPSATYVMVALIVVLVFTIIDLDRPRRGIIEVDQSTLLELGAQAAIARDSAR